MQNKRQPDFTNSDSHAINILNAPKTDSQRDANIAQAMYFAAKNVIYTKDKSNAGRDLSLTYINDLRLSLFGIDKQASDPKTSQEELTRILGSEHEFDTEDTTEFRSDKGLLGACSLVTRFTTMLGLRSDEVKRFPAHVTRAFIEAYQALGDSANRFSADLRGEDEWEIKNINYVDSVLDLIETIYHFNQVDIISVDTLRHILGRLPKNSTSYGRGLIGFLSIMIRELQRIEDAIFLALDQKRITFNGHYNYGCINTCTLLAASLRDNLELVYKHDELLQKEISYLVWSLCDEQVIDLHVLYFRHVGHHVNWIHIEESLKSGHTTLPDFWKDVLEQSIAEDKQNRMHIVEDMS